ncbi:hypothetical protein RJ640_024692 [Escallonia rubra]|uniref:Beta-glucosidase n=1 Tax=Escallonia rubra TaxID=112253 RepID=A0AA88SHW6_9ASTE|nr:hypothetical protein RJ640_024692 [Escallonia rubra]
MAAPVLPGATFRPDFPEGFIFGASTSAFQIEGAVDEDGRDGKASGGPFGDGKNQQGIIFYNNLIDRLLLLGIIPIVTLSHWDIPQALDDEYGGLLSPEIT